MRDRNRRAFAAVALILGVAWLSSIRGDAGDTNDHGFVSSAHAQPPQPIRKLLEWLRAMTLPGGIIKAEGRIEATQIDVSSKYAGELVEVAVQEGNKVAAGQVIARVSSPELEAQLQAAQLKLRSAQEARAEDAIKAAEAKVEQIKSMIGDLRLVSPREGKIQYQLAYAGDHVAAGAPIVTLIDLTDVYMTVFVRVADAAKLGLGDEARLILDAAPDYVIPATVGFVASNPQSASNAVETKEELAKQMLRIDLKVDPKVLQAYYAKVETGLRGAGFVRTKPDAKWPADLQVKLPPAPVAQRSPPAPAPVEQQAGSPSEPTAGPSTQSTPAAAPMSPRAPAPVADAAAPAPVATQATPTLSPTSAPAPAPDAEASTSAPVARQAEPIPPPPLVHAPPSPPAPARSPAAQASMSAGLGQMEPVAEVAPESLAQLRGAWAQSTDDCKKLFQRRGSALTYRQPVDQFARAVIIESQRIRLPTGVCRLERASHEGGALKLSGECQDSISYTPQTAYVKLRSKDEIVFNPNGDPALDTSMMRCAL
ncbi:MAG TPA: HlyD family efflux transporter periplasmic adaptor subunit [Roseiarcus sp.]|nr:HlyD family efflux transporter periplasmic adaptor subunit [Roseiarcus sp.]